MEHLIRLGWTPSLWWMAAVLTPTAIFLTHKIFGLPIKRCILVGLLFVPFVVDAGAGLVALIVGTAGLGAVHLTPEHPPERFGDHLYRLHRRRVIFGFLFVPGLVLELFLFLGTAVRAESRLRPIIAITLIVIAAGALCIGAVLVSSTPAVRKKATDDEIEAAAQRRARGEPPLVPPSTLWAWLSFRRRDPLRQITDAERNRVWVEHGPRCAYCHRVTIRGGKRHERYEADHIKPHSLGGHSSPMLNICVSCGRCNGKKGNSYGLQSRLVAHELKKWATRPVPVPASNQFGEY